MYRYIQVDDDGIITADSYFAVEWEDEHCIPVSSDFDPTDKRYDFATKEWVHYVAPIPPDPPYVPTLQEQIDELKANQLSSDEAITNCEVGLAETFEATVTLSDDLTETQLALAEVYELVIGG